jgi:hypothetical protein
MPARISRGLSRNGRRPLGASEGPLGRLGVIVVAVAGVVPYSFTFRRLFSSLMNSLMSRK